MIDTHTHILPGMDDGAQDLAESLQMLRVCQAQGVQTVVLTPHFYPDLESAETFLQRRAEAFAQLSQAVTPDMPRLVLGAEVAWCLGIERMDRLQELTMGRSPWLLLEMPYAAWKQEHLDSLWHLRQSGNVIPVLAHIERFVHLQRHGQYETLLDMQLPMQISAGEFGRLFHKKKALRMMQWGQWMIGSDCHDLSRRPPCMATAAQYLQTYAPEKTAALHWDFEK